MKAEEFLKNRFGIHDKVVYDGEYILDFYAIVEAMEAYLKQEVEAITDEEIKKASNDNPIYISSAPQIWEMGAKWFKNKLLKQ